MKTLKYIGVGSIVIWIFGEWAILIALLLGAYVAIADPKKYSILHFIGFIGMFVLLLIVISFTFAFILQ